MWHPMLINKLYRLVQHVLDTRANPDVWNLASMDKAHKLAVEIASQCNKSEVDTDNGFFQRLHDECFPQDNQE